MNQLLVYTDFVTERLDYTLKFICQPRGIHFQFCNDPIRFEHESNKAKLVYSTYPFEHTYPTIQPAKLLFEDDVKSQDLNLFKNDKLECLSFDHLPDALASIFYIISRYEEYLPYHPDAHDRFTSKHSILNTYNWLQKPIADIWAEYILNQILEYYPEFQITKPKAILTLTFDIDNTFAFKHKNIVQLLGGRLKDFIQGNSPQQELRRKVLNNQISDPNDTFDVILNYAQSGNNVKVFWHLGDFKKHDRNITWTNAVHQRLIQKMAAKIQVGIHPSYFSYLNERLVKQERGRLEHIIKKPVFHSRQHFLKVRFPGTFELLNNITIKHDYSVGFADAVGFRMGTAQALPFYNLLKDEVTSLILHPFVYMDGTLNQYLKQSPEKAKETVDKLIQEVKIHGGDFICIWHNDTINNQGEWEDWKQVLDYTIQQFNAS